MKKIFIAAGAAVGAMVLALAFIVGSWYFRGNASEVSDLVSPEIWTAVSDGRHNSNTDLIFFNGYFYLVHASSPFHMGTSDSRIVIRRSRDARNWIVVRELQLPGTDVRDPKFAVIRGRLFLYVLKNMSLEPEPFATAVSISSDGETWSPLRDVRPQGWLFWRPKTRDGRTWYVTAYWHEHGRSMLFRSTDGIAWEEVSEIHSGDRNDETDFEFLDDGRIIATARLEGDRSWHQGAFNASTLIAVASPPFLTWTTTVSRLTRLDGPVLFRYRGRIFAVARFDPEGYERWYGMSSLLGRKRTSIYEVTPAGLRRLTDLPSAGDTSYPGIVLMDGILYISYYTSNIERDYSWLLGLVCPSDIMMARIDMERLKF